MNQNQKTFIEKNKYLLVLLITLLIAFFLFFIRINKYGIGFDEYYFYQFSQLNLHAIFSFISGMPFDQLTNFYDLKFYGPAYIIFGEFLIEKVQNIYPTLDIYHAWHTLNFATFLSGAWILYILGKRFLSEKASLFAAFLYLTQPLLWGHGIMNPKDTPFMVFFLSAVTVGIISVDKIAAYVKGANQTKTKSSINKMNVKTKTVFLFLIILCGLFTLVFTADRVTSNSISRPVIDNLFVKIENSSAGSVFFPVKMKIDSGETRGIPVSSYKDKTFRIINSIEFYFLAISIFSFVSFQLVKFSSTTRWTIFAAFLLGLTMSIRILGPAAGGLIGLYAILKLGKKSWKFLLIYTGLSLLIMYLFWPRLWIDPINRFIEAFKVMSNFPWPGAVRFENGEFLATELPWYFLPKIISIQLTLPTMFLALVGVVIAIKNKLLINSDLRKTIIIMCWFFIPFLGVVLFQPAMYDNFRQFFFIIPPLFIFAALAFEKIISVITRKLIVNLVFLVLLLPGIVAGIWLDPYEYVYYNALVGWTGNVGRKYETDYWNTSFCESAQYLSKNAQEGSSIGFTDSIAALIFSECTDKKFEIVIERVENSQQSLDYSVVSTRYDDDIDYFRTMTPLKMIERGHTPFLLIRSK